MIHYFIYGANIESVQDAEQAAKYCAAWQRKVEHAAYIKAWRAKEQAERAEADASKAGVPGAKG